jgi:hypothetical protein
MTMAFRYPENASLTESDTRRNRLPDDVSDAKPGH